MEEVANMAIDIVVKQVAADDIASKELLGRTNQKTTRLTLFGTDVNANWAAERILRRNSYPALEGQLSFHHSAFKLLVGDLFKLSLAQYGITDLVCRVMNISLGAVDSETIEVTFMQDLEYTSTPISLPATTVYPSSTSWKILPLDPVYIVDAPYDFIGDKIAILPLVGRTSGSEIAYDLYISHNGGTSYSLLKTYDSYCMHATLVEEITRHYPTVTDKIFPITIDFTRKKEVNDPESIDRTSLFSGDNLAILFDGTNYGEIFAFQTITPSNTVSGRASLTGLLRGKYDTLMRDWPIGTDVFIIRASAIEAIEDSTFFVGATKYFKLIPYNHKYTSDIEDATAYQYTITGRGKSPFPVANLRANGIGLDHIGVKPSYDNTVLLEWTPNLRGAGAGIDLATQVTDPGQSWEGYFQVEVYIASSLVRTVNSINQLSYEYHEALMREDNSGSIPSDIDFSVRNYIETNNIYYKSEALTISATRSATATTTTTTTTTTSTTTSTTTTTI